jgi:hypothetical protein
MRLKYDTGAKIINLIREVVELETNTAADDEHLAESVDVLLDTEVIHFVCLL